MPGPQPGGPQVRCGDQSGLSRSGAENPEEEESELHRGGGGRAARHPHQNPPGHDDQQSPHDRVLLPGLQLSSVSSRGSHQVKLELLLLMFSTIIAIPLFYEGNNAVKGRPGHSVIIS